MVSEKLLEEFDRLIGSNMKKYQIPGMAAAIVSSEEIIFQKCYGYRDIESHLPVDENTLFGIGSTTKALTAIAILRLVQEQKLNLNDPIDNLLGFSVSLPSFPITLHHLLCHYSGIPDLGLAEYLLSSRFQERTFDFSLETKDDIQAHIVNAKGFFIQPGTIPFYSNMNYYLL